MLEVYQYETRAFLDWQYERINAIFQKIKFVSICKYPFFKDMEGKVSLVSHERFPEVNFSEVYYLFNDKGIVKGYEIFINPYQLCHISDDMVAYVLGHELIHFLFNEERYGFLLRNVIKKAYPLSGGNQYDKKMLYILYNALFRGSEYRADFLSLMLIKEAGYKISFDEIKRLYQQDFDSEDGLHVDIYKLDYAPVNLHDCNYLFEDGHPCDTARLMVLENILKGGKINPFSFRFYDFWEMEEALIKDFPNVVDREGLWKQFNNESSNIKDELKNMGQKFYNDGLQIIEETMAISKVIIKDYLLKEHTEKELFATIVETQNMLDAISGLKKKVPILDAYKKVFDMCMKIIQYVEDTQHKLIDKYFQITGKKINQDEVLDTWEERIGEFVETRYHLVTPIPTTNAFALDFKSIGYVVKDLQDTLDNKLLKGQVNLPRKI